MGLIYKGPNRIEVAQVRICLHYGFGYITELHGPTDGGKFVTATRRSAARASQFV